MVNSRLINNVNDFTCNMKCGFLASFMDELQSNWCVELLAGFLDIALSLVLLAFFNIPVCICAAILVNRFRGKWRVGNFAGADEGGRSSGPWLAGLALLAPLLVGLWADAVLGFMLPGQG